MKYYLSVLKNYANFNGRARRSEYWFFVLFNVIFSIGALLIDYLLGTRFDYDQVYGESYIHIHLGYINIFYGLAMFIPGLAVLVRRLHDVGKSGWFAFICLIPLVGPIWILVLLFTDSKPGVNQYGPNPKGIGNNDEIDEIGNDIQK